MPPIINLTDARIHMQFDYDPKKIKMLKWLGGRWTSKSKTWSLPNKHIFRECLDVVFPRWREKKNDQKPILEIPSYLMSHQKEGLKKAHLFDRFGFFYGCGTGKTLIGIEIHKMVAGKTLVVCPRALINNAWIDDMRKFAAQIPYLDAHKTRKKKHFQQLVKDSSVVIINFESFRSISKILEKAGFDVLLIDESSKIKNPGAKITKALTNFADDIKRVYLFSGTPAPNTPEEYFSQMRVLDPKIFGTSAGKFKATWFYTPANDLFKSELLPRKKDLFFKRIARCSEVVTKEDALDLPDRTYIDRKFELSNAEIAAYRTMTDSLYILVKEKRIATTTKLTQVMKLRQITAGSIIDEEKVVHKVGSSKLEALRDLLEEIGNEQAVIWTQFKFEAKEIEEMISKKLKRSCAFCNGFVNSKKQDEAILDFDDKKIQFLIAHPKTIAHGVTLIGCYISIDFSLSYSYEDFAQKNDRIHRKGQRKPCIYYTLKACVDGKPTIDDVVHKAVARKKRVEASAFDHIKKFSNQRRGENKRCNPLTNS